MAEIDYVVMLRESLEKKVDVLRVLNRRTHEQTQILQDPTSAPEDLEANMDQKQELIEAIDGLDKGFDILFKRVQAALEGHKEEYADEINIMKSLIKEITDLTVDIQATEQKNKEYAKTRFANVRKEIREIKKSHEAVSTYYQSMMAKRNTADPAFVDKKK